MKANSGTSPRDRESPALLLNKTGSATAAFLALASCRASRRPHVQSRMLAVQSTPSTPAIQSEGTTLLLHLDHMNDPKGYCGLLCDWSRQLSISGPLFVPFDERHQSLTDTKRRPRHVLAVLDCASPDGGKEVLRRLRTQNVDVTVRGQPCKERMSTVVAELAPSDDGFPAEAAPGLELIRLDGSSGPQAHMPEVRSWLRAARPGDADTIIARFDEHLDASTKPGQRR